MRLRKQAHKSYNEKLPSEKQYKTICYIQWLQTLYLNEIEINLASLTMKSKGKYKLNVY